MSLNNSTFLLQEKIADYGFFCRVAMSVEILDEDKIIVKYDNNSCWFDSVYWGCKYFYQKYNLYAKKGLNIRITQLDAHSIDTTDIVVVYSVIRCLEKLVQFEIKGLEINGSGNFVIPK